MKVVLNPAADSQIEKALICESSMLKSKFIYILFQCMNVIVIAGQIIQCPYIHSLK